MKKMSKLGTYFLVILLSIIVFLLEFNYKSSKDPNIYYKVYLDSEFIGTIESKKELEEYINNQSYVIKDNIKKYSLILESIETFKKYESSIINQYTSKSDKVTYLLSNKNVYNFSDIELENLKFYLQEKLYNYRETEIIEMKNYVEENNIYNFADEIYTPNGIEVKKEYTYNKEIITVPEMYKRIVQKKSCTIAGYKFTIKSNTEGIDDIIIYTLDRETFSSAIDKVITIFVDSEKYESYKTDNQLEITTTGSTIDNIYVEQDITYKAVNISVEEKIYTDATSLSAYLLYGDNFEQKTVTVKQGDSIESISFENQISVQEFLIFNTQYTNRDNLLVSGTDVTISTIDPKIRIVVEYYEVVDKETEFATEEQYDENLNQGSVVVSQQGENGLERVTQNVKSINGEIAYVEPVDKEIIKNPVPKIINIGTKYIPNVGSTASWGWPTESGYTFSSYYGYRLAVFGEGNFHSGLDIAGTGYGSRVYAANNGTIEEMGYIYSYGNYIMINHNNGYYTLYAHMSGFNKDVSLGSTVSRGQVIGYVGSSGWATGPHLHYEIRTCSKYACTTNPLKYYR